MPELRFIRGHFSPAKFGKLGYRLGQFGPFHLLGNLEHEDAALARLLVSLLTLGCYFNVRFVADLVGINLSRVGDPFPKFLGRNGEVFVGCYYPQYAGKVSKKKMEIYIFYLKFVY